MFARSITRAPRTGAVVVLLVLSVLPLLAGGAAGQESLSDLEDRMGEIRAELDGTTARIERLRTDADELRHRIAYIEQRKRTLERRSATLEGHAVQRADELYRSGGTNMVEVLFTAKSVSQLTDRAEMLSQVSVEGAGVFVRLARSRAELAHLDEELSARTAELADTMRDLEQASESLQGKLADVAAEYEALQRELEAAARRRAAAAANAAAPDPAPDPAPAPASNAVAPVVKRTSGMACPVAGPVSFVDSWGAPRSGHTHQGVDMMAAYGTPIVAIVTGRVTYSGYDGSGGYMIFLSGNDGNAYWYMHNQKNLVGGGAVRVGQQIATVGDTGNAAGTPHLHFEYHPGGGAAVNPYPLVAAIC